MPVTFATRVWRSSAPLRFAARAIAVGVLFAAFAAGVDRNPPGFYVDESALSYNAYLVSQTGAGETGERFPLFFPVYTSVFTQYANPTHVYLLAAVFKIFGPGILAARLTAAACVFAACMLLGLLAKSISGSRSIGTIVALMAAATPWLFEVGRLVLETFFYPLAVVLLLGAVLRASRVRNWGVADSAALVAALALLTYSYTIGRLLGPLMAGGLVLFATSRARILSIVRVWLAYGLTLIPLALYVREHPAITARFRVLSYIRRDAPVMEMVTTFLGRFLEDINPLTMLVSGDDNRRHHLSGPDGSFYWGVFALAVIGLGVAAARHRRDPWWLYVVFGLLASVVPGALTNDPFHTLRMVAYPVFLILITVPALMWMTEPRDTPAEETVRPSLFSPAMRIGALTALLTVGAVQAGHFFWRYYNEGSARGEYFDAEYKTVYDEAVAQPERPIYLVDGYWGPGYVHALWYATLEGRDTGEFVHQPYHTRPPVGSLVISSEDGACETCDVIFADGAYQLYIQGDELLPADAVDR